MDKIIMCLYNILDINNLSSYLVNTRIAQC
jgi:hypothetical protein